MKNYLKRVLALVLAFSMCASMSVVGASANNYSLDVKDEAGQDSAELTVGDSDTLSASWSSENGQLGSWSGGGTDETVFPGGDDYDYNAALYIADNSVVLEKSNIAQIHSGKYDENNASGIVISDKTAGDNGIIVVDSDYEITGANITLNTDADGSNTCDFSGKGSAIAVFGEKASVTLIKSTIETTGVATMPVFVDDGATVTIVSSTLISNGGSLYDSYVNSPSQDTMVAPPWILGIMGTSRCTNLMGNDSTMNVVDSTTKASNWAVLSTDSGSDMYLNMYNTTLELTGKDESKIGTDLGKGKYAGFGGGLTVKDNPYTVRYGAGYGTYVIGNAVEAFAGTTVNVGTYGMIFTGGTATLSSTEAGKSYDLKNSAGETTYVYTASESKSATINSDTFGIMAHQGTNVLNVEKGSTIDSGYTSFLIKTGCDFTANVDGATIKNGNNVLIQIMDNDDSTTPFDGAAMAFGTTHTENAGFPTEATGTASSKTATFNFTNGKYTGNIYNGSGYVANDQGGQTATALVVNVGKDATLTSAVAPTSAMHITYEGEQALKKDYNGFAFKNSSELTAATKAYNDFNSFVSKYQNTSFTISEYYDIGHVANMVNFNGENTVDVVLTDNAVWTLTGDSYVSSLTIKDDAKVVIPAGMTLTIGSGDTAVVLTANEKTQTVIATNTCTTSPATVNDNSGTLDLAAKSLTDGVYKFENVDQFRILAVDGNANPSGLATDVNSMLVQVKYNSDAPEALKGQTFVYSLSAGDGLLSVLNAAGEEINPTVYATATLVTDENGEAHEIASVKGEDLSGGDTTITVVPSSYLAPGAALGTFDALKGFGYRSAYVINSKGVDIANSVAVTNKGKDTKVSIDDISGETITGTTSGYSGVIVNTGSATEQTLLKDVTIKLGTEDEGASDGTDVNDFAGYGAGVAVFGGSLVKLENADIETTGVGKLATFADDGSDLIVVNSKLTAKGGTTYESYKSTANQSYMIAPPWVLGIAGNVRATNVMGKGTTATYVDSTLSSHSWGVVSSDSGSSMLINVVNSVVKFDSEDSAGYGAYVIGDTTVENFIGSSFQGGTYAIIMTGGTANLKSYSYGDQVIVDKITTGAHVTELTADLTAENGNFVKNGITSENQAVVKAYQDAVEALQTAEENYEKVVADRAAYEAFVEAAKTYFSTEKDQNGNYKDGSYAKYAAAKAAYDKVNAYNEAVALYINTWKGTNGYTTTRPSNSKEITFNPTEAGYQAYIAYHNAEYNNGLNGKIPGTQVALADIPTEAEIAAAAAFDPQSKAPELTLPTYQYPYAVTESYTFYTVEGDSAQTPGGKAVNEATELENGTKKGVIVIDDGKITVMENALKNAQKAFETAEKNLKAAKLSINTTVEGTTFGFMFHANGTDNVNTLNIGNGTSISTESTTFLLKKVNNTINIGDGASKIATSTTAKTLEETPKETDSDKKDDNKTTDTSTAASKITIERTGKTENTVLLQVMDNDDDFVGAFSDSFFGMPTFNYTFSEQSGWSNTWGNTPSSGNYSDTLNVNNTDLVGNVFNATGYTTSNPGAILNVNLKNSDLTGLISTAAFQHTTKNFTYYDKTEGVYDDAKVAAAAAKLGHVTNKPVASTDGVNGVNVTLSGDSVWTLGEYKSDEIKDYEKDTKASVESESYKIAYIDSLTISGNAKVKIPQGYTLVIDGEAYKSTTPQGITLGAKADGTAQVYGTVAVATDNNGSHDENGFGGGSGGGEGMPGEGGGAQGGVDIGSAPVTGGDTAQQPGAGDAQQPGGDQQPGGMPGEGGGDIDFVGGETGAVATTQTVKWSIDGTTTATLEENKDGTVTVTGVAAGTATVTATLIGGDGETVLATDTFVITVNEPAPEEPNETPAPEQPGDETPAPDETPAFTYTDDSLIADWAYDAIYGLTDLGVLTGYANGDGTYAIQPLGTITRAEVAKTLYGLAGSPAVTGTNPFTDATASWYQDAIKWAVSEGVITGRDATTFDPDAAVTREEMLTMLWRYAGKPDANANLTVYGDNGEVSSYALPAVTWAVARGVTNGTTENGVTLLDPQGVSTRQQVFTMVYRFIAE